jgi:hypothetical protein
MPIIATGGFEVTHWQEELIAAHEGGRRLARATVEVRYHGGIEGHGATEYLMAYKADGTAEFVGLQRIEGSVGERAGAIVLQVTGSFDGSSTRADWRIVRGAGSAELSRTAGAGTFQAGLDRAGRYRLECSGSGGG